MTIGQLNKIRLKVLKFLVERIIRMLIKPPNKGVHLLIAFSEECWTSYWWATDLCISDRHLLRSALFKRFISSPLYSKHNTWTGSMKRNSYLSETKCHAIFVKGRDHKSIKINSVSLSCNPFYQKDNFPLQSVLFNCLIISWLWFFSISTTLFGCKTDLLGRSRIETTRSESIF